MPPPFLSAGGSFEPCPRCSSGSSGSSRGVCGDGGRCPRPAALAFALPFPGRPSLNSAAATCRSASKFLAVCSVSLGFPISAGAPLPATGMMLCTVPPRSASGNNAASARTPCMSSRCSTGWTSTDSPGVRPLDTRSIPGCVGRPCPPSRCGSDRCPPMSIPLGGRPSTARSLLSRARRLSSCSRTQLRRVVELIKKTLPAASPM